MSGFSQPTRYFGSFTMVLSSTITALPCPSLRRMAAQLAPDRVDDGAFGSVAGLMQTRQQSRLEFVFGNFAEPAHAAEIGVGPSLGSQHRIDLRRPAQAARHVLAALHLRQPVRCGGSFLLRLIGPRLMVGGQPRGLAGDGAVALGIGDVVRLEVVLLEVCALRVCFPSFRSSKDE
jgi:hypothetical protein